MASLVLTGDTSGQVTLAAPAVAGTTTLTLPATTGTVLNDATVGVCRAWVNFNGTGTVAIRASFNVTNITDNGVGEYAINFTTAMTDANYASMGCAMKQDGNGYSVYPNAKSTAPYYTAPSTSSFSLITSLTYNSSQRGDCEYINISVFR